MAYTLTIPRQRDPVARAVLLLALGGALWLGVTQPSVPAAAQTEMQPIIIQSTPALPITPLPTESPTAMPEPTAAPVEALAAPTPEPQIVYQQVIVEVPAEPQIIYVEQQAPALHDLSQDPNAAPSCAAGVSDAYCGLEVQQVGPAPAQPYEPMTEREQQYSRARTR